MQKRIVILIASVIVLMQTFSSAQQSQKPMTNDDIITMVKNKLPETVVISAIQAHPSQFNTSTPELIRLQKSGVTENELNAMIAASNKGAAVSSPAKPTAESTAGAPVALPASKSHMPKLYLTSGGAARELPLEKTQLAETKTKPSSMKSLAADSAVTQAMQSGINTVAYSAASHVNS